MREHIESPEKGLAELFRLYSNEDNLTSMDFYDIAVCMTYFGELEFALNAMARSVKLQANALYWIYSPGMREV